MSRPTSPVAISTAQSRLPTFNTAVDLHPCIETIQQETGRVLAAIVAHPVATDILERVILGDAARLLADHNRQLPLGLECPGRRLGDDDVVFCTDERMHRAAIRLWSLRVVGRGAAPASHAFHMAAIVGPRSVEHGGRTGGQSFTWLNGELIRVTGCCAKGLPSTTITRSPSTRP